MGWHHGHGRLDDPDRIAEIQATLDLIAGEPFARIARFACAGLHAEASLVALMTATEFVVLGSAGLPRLDPDRPVAVPADDTFPTLLDATNFVAVGDMRVEGSPLPSSVLSGHGFASYAALAIRDEADVMLGVICTLSRKPRVWTDADRGILKDLSDSVRHKIELRRIIRAREASEESLRQSEFRYRTVSRSLESEVRRRTEELAHIQTDILDRLTQVVEFHDDATGKHTRRVGLQASRIAVRLGLNEALVQHIRNAAPLHDVGKVGVPDSILLKPGRLTEEEMEVMKGHTVIGARILSGGSSDLLQIAERIARSHHEKWDGSGYPDGQAGEDIPIEARIVAVADVFDALSHDRPYRPAWHPEQVRSVIWDGAGTEFDPRICEAFLSILDARAH